MQCLGGLDLVSDNLRTKKPLMTKSYQLRFYNLPLRHVFLEGRGLSI